MAVQYICPLCHTAQTLTEGQRHCSECWRPLGPAGMVPVGAPEREVQPLTQEPNVVGPPVLYVCTLCRSSQILTSGQQQCVHCKQPLDRNGMYSTDPNDPVAIRRSSESSTLPVGVVLITGRLILTVGVALISAFIAFFSSTSGSRFLVGGVQLLLGFGVAYVAREFWATRENGRKLAQIVSLLNILIVGGTIILSGNLTIQAISIFIDIIVIIYLSQEDVKSYFA